jgi:hypothetical protein
MTWVLFVHNWRELEAAPDPGSVVVESVTFTINRMAPCALIEFNEPTLSLGGPPPPTYSLVDEGRCDCINVVTGRVTYTPPGTLDTDRAECIPYDCAAIEGTFDDAILLTRESRPATPADYIDTIPFEPIGSTPNWGTLFDLQEMTTENPLTSVPKVPFIDECGDELFVLRLGQALLPKVDVKPPPGVDRLATQALMTGSGTITLINFIQEWRQDVTVATSFWRSTQFSLQIDETPKGTMRLNLVAPNDNDHIVNTLDGFGAYNSSLAQYEGEAFSVWDDEEDFKIWRIVSASISRGLPYLITPTQWGFDVSVVISMEYYDDTGELRTRTQTASITIESFNVNVGGNEGEIVFPIEREQTLYPIGGGGSMFLAALRTSGIGSDLSDATLEEWALAIRRNRTDYTVPTSCVISSGATLSGSIPEACVPFSCDSLEAVIPGWANGLLEVDSQFDPDIPDFNTIFPMDGLTPRANTTVLTDWGGITPRALTENETVPPIEPCDVDPVAAVRGSASVNLLTPELQAFAVYSADGDGAFPGSSLWTVNYDYVSTLGASGNAFNLFFRNQGDGTARLEFETTQIAYAASNEAGESTSFNFAAPSIPFTLGGTDNWYTAFVRVIYGTPFRRVSPVNSVPYWYMPILVDAIVWNMDGDPSTISEQFNIADVGDPSNNINVTALTHESVVFEMAEKRVAAAASTSIPADIDPGELMLAVLRNRSTYRLPASCYLDTPECVIYSCSALEDIAGVAQFVSVGEPAWEDWFPAAGLTPLNFSGTATEFDADVNFSVLEGPTYAPYDPCPGEPSHILAFGLSGRFEMSSPDKALILHRGSIPSQLPNGEVVGLGFNIVDGDDNVLTTASPVTLTYRLTPFNSGADTALQLQVSIAGQAKLPGEAYSTGSESVSFGPYSNPVEKDFDAFVMTGHRLSWGNVRAESFGPFGSSWVVDVTLTVYAALENGNSIYSHSQTFEVRAGSAAAAEPADLAFTLKKLGISNTRVAMASIGSPLTDEDFSAAVFSWKTNRKDYEPPLECLIGAESKFEIRCVEEEGDLTYALVVDIGDARSAAIASSDDLIIGVDADGMLIATDKSGATFDLNIDMVGGLKAFVIGLEGPVLTAFTPASTIPTATVTLSDAPDPSLPFVLDMTGATYNTYVTIPRENVDRYRLLEALSAADGSDPVAPETPDAPDLSAAGTTVLDSGEASAPLTADTVGGFPAKVIGNAGTVGEVYVPSAGFLLPDGLGAGVPGMKSETREVFSTAVPARPFVNPYWSGVSAIDFGVRDFTFKTKFKPGREFFVIGSSGYVTPAGGRYWRSGGIDILGRCDATRPAISLCINPNPAEAFAGLDNRVIQGSKFVHTATFDIPMLVDEVYEFGVSRRDGVFTMFLSGRKQFAIDTFGDTLTPIITPEDWDYWLMGAYIAVFDGDEQITTLSSPCVFGEATLVMDSAAYEEDFSVD